MWQPTLVINTAQQTVAWKIRAFMPTTIEPPPARSKIDPSWHQLKKIGKTLNGRVPCLTLA
jgi:hypothetical protein